MDSAGNSQPNAPRAIVQSRVAEDGIPEIAIGLAPIGPDGETPDLSALRSMDMFDRGSIPPVNQPGDVRQRAQPGRPVLGGGSGLFSLETRVSRLSDFGLVGFRNNFIQGASHSTIDRDFVAIASARYVAFDHYVDFSVNPVQKITFSHGPYSGTAEVFQIESSPGDVFVKVNDGATTFASRIPGDIARLGFILPLEGTLAKRGIDDESLGELLGTWTVSGDPQFSDQVPGTTSGDFYLHPGPDQVGAGATPFTFTLKALVVDTIQSTLRDTIPSETGESLFGGVDFNVRVKMVSSANFGDGDSSNTRFEDRNLGLVYKAEVFEDGGETVRLLYGVGPNNPINVDENKPVDETFTIEWDGTDGSGNRLSADKEYGVIVTVMLAGQNSLEPPLSGALGYIYTLSPGVGPEGVEPAFLGETIEISPNPYIPYTEEEINNYDPDTFEWLDNDGDGIPNFPDKDGDGQEDFAAGDQPPPVTIRADLEKPGFDTTWIVHILQRPKDFPEDPNVPNGGWEPVLNAQTTNGRFYPRPGSGNIDLDWDIPQDLDQEMEYNIQVVIDRCRPTNVDVQVLGRNIRAQDTSSCDILTITKKLVFGEGLLILTGEASMRPSYLVELAPIFSPGELSQQDIEVSYVGEVSPISVELEVSATTNSGGHNEDLFGGTRPVGSLGESGPRTRMTLESGSPKKIKYTAPDEGGEYGITVTALTEGAGLEPQTLKICVEVPELETLTDFGEPSHYDRTGLTAVHPFGSHYATSETNKRALNLARAYYNAKRNDPTFSDKRLWINDMSLIKGGHFSIQGDWAATQAHGGHRKGVEFDVNNELIIQGIHDLTLEEYAAEYGFLINDEVVGGRHYHLRLDEKKPAAEPSLFPWAPPVTGAPSPDFEPTKGN